MERCGDGKEMGAADQLENTTPYQPTLPGPPAPGEPTTAVEQEGLRLPPVRLFKEGEMDEEIFSIIST